MLHHALHLEMFNPSTSWISKAGVKLEYTPEDTLKSVIFPQCDPDISPNERIIVSQETPLDQNQNESTTQSCGDQYAPDLEQMNSEVNESKDSGAAGYRENPDGAPVYEANDMLHMNEHVPGSKKPLTPNPLSVERKPAPFLKRRQGIAAWCSKMRRQGIPIADPSEAILKKQPNMQNRPIKAKTIHSPAKHNCPDKDSVDLDQNNPPRRTKQVHSPRLTTTLWCGPPLIKQLGDQPPLTEHSNQSNMTSKLGDLVESSTDQVNEPACLAIITNEDSHNDAADLEEFELLEEFAETSSFSSLTTSFVAKLGKTNLRERLAQAENQAKRLNLFAKTEDSNLDIQSHRSPSTASAQSGHPDGLDLAKSTFANFNSHSSLGPFNHSEDEDLPNESVSRTTQGILTSSTANRNRKIARFHMVETTKPDPTDKIQTSSYWSSEAENVDSEHESSMDKHDLNVSRSYDLDDTSSWNQSACDLNQIKDKNADSGLNLSATNSAPTVAPPPSPSVSTPAPVTSSGGGGGGSHSTPDIAMVPATAMPMTTRTSHRQSNLSVYSDQETKHPDRKLSVIESGDRKRTGIYAQDSDRRSRSNSLTRSSSVRIGSTTQLKGSNSCVVSSYEEELATLADEFIGKLRREPQSPNNRMNINSAALLRQWIGRLEAEVKRFKIENNQLNKMRSEREEGMRRLEQEIKRFEDNKAKEIKQLNELRENEMRKIKKERRVLEEYQRALKTMPSKKDRDEIERLKDDLNEARNDLGRREARWHAAISRLRSRIEELESERDDLKNRVIRLEEERLRLQSQIAKLQLASDTSKDSSTGRLSNSLKQTLNSISQSVSLNPSRTEFSKPNEVIRHATTTSTAIERIASTPISNDKPITRPNTSVLARPGPPSRSQSSASRRSDLEVHSTANTTMKSNRTGTVASANTTNTTDHRCHGIVRRESIPVVTGTNSHLYAGDEQTKINPPVDCSSTSFKQGDQPTKLPVVASSDATNRTDDSSLHLKPSTQETLLPNPGTAASGTVIRSVKHTDGSLEETYSNGAVVISYSNGSVKEIFPDTVTIVVSLFNGDIKRTLPDGRVIYHYAADGTVQTTYPNGVEEIAYADGRRETIHPISANCVPPTSIPHTDSNLTSSIEQSFRRLPNGDKEILLPNGQREIHSTSGIKCRIYPDGTVKTVFPDGRHETRYSSGRLRVKDSDGNLILDTRLPVGSTQPVDKIAHVQNPVPNSLKAAPTISASTNKHC